MAANCLPIHSTSKRSAKLPHAASSSIENCVRPDRKIQSLRVPPGKLIKAQALLIEGNSQRSVCRTLHMSEHTVAKIIRTEDFQNFIKGQRERLFAIAPVALESFQARVATDGHLAYAFLKDVGIIPDRETMLNLMNPAPPEMASEETLADRQNLLIASVMQERYRVFGTPLPPDIEAAIDQDNAAETTVPHR